MKKNVMIRINKDLVLKAKDYGLNISKVSENA
jgi:post-segregation antitoxin (ccd killing protein)